VKAADIPRFVGVPVYAFIVGRAIYGADDVAAAAKTFQDALRQSFH
jgi:3-keto-L-gulonate-6-phosphate decarboxylase